VPSVEQAMAMMRAGEADAFALSKDSLRPLIADFPGARILDDAFHLVGIAIAVPKNRPAALAYVSAFLEEAKASGSVRRALDRAGMKDEAVAPAGR
jgi:polar amino acid transport system substrate-binding protein